MASRLRQTVQSIEGTPAEELGLKPGVVSDPVGAARVAAEMLPGSGFVTGVQKGGTEGGIDFLAELLGIAGGIGGAVAGPPGIVGGYMGGKGAVKGLRSLLKKEVSENLPEYKKGLKSVEIDEDLFKDILKTSEGDPVVLYRGILPHEDKKITESILEGKSREGYATFLSDNPSIAESYAGKEGAVTPFIVKPKKIIEYEDKYTRQNVIGIDFDKFEFDKQARNLKEGEVLVVRNVRDTGPRVIQSGPNDPKYWSYGGDVYAVKDENVLVSAISPSTKISKEAVPEKISDKAVAKQGAKKSSILNKMEECVENIGYANCKLAAQLTSDTKDFSKLKTINISEEDEIVTEFFDSGTINNLTKNLEKGDILNFNERHYSIYSGNGKVVQVPEWGGKAEEVPLIGVLKEYNLPTNIYKAAKIKAKKKQGGSVVERNPYDNYQARAI